MCIRDSTCTVWKRLAQVPDGFAPLPIDDLPPDWRAGLPGEWLVGLHVLVKPAITPRDELPPLVRSMLDEDSLVGARVMDGCLLYTSRCV